MSKKRAFVKYTKSGELIPGSLIITTKGGYPKDGIYKEVDVDLCCDPVCPECPPPITCFALRNDSNDPQTVEGVLCGGTTSGDHEAQPGEILCVQVYFGSSGGFTGVGPCQL